MRRYRRMALGLLCVACASAWCATGAWAAGSPGAAAWGNGTSGQLGDGTMSSSLYPAPVSDLTGVTAVAAGKAHGLALLESGKVMAWGDNASGDLGNGSTTASDVPVEVSGISTAVAVAAGQEFSLALLANGTVMAWGQNKEGELGDGTITNSEVPVAVKGLSEVVAIAAGSRHALAVLQDGKVMAWGADGLGQLGNGTTTSGEVEPVAVNEISEAKTVAAGGLSSYAVLSDGTVEAWGDNGKGQLGDGNTTNSDVPVAVKGLVGAQAVSAGENHALALVSGGSVYAWGNGEQGELGNGEEHSAALPVQVSSLTEATAVAAGSHFSLALLSNGTIDAWGGNTEGELGNGGTTATDTPVAIPGIDEVKGIAAGSQYGLAYGPALPTVTAVTPSYGPATGVSSVTLTGTHFTGATSVEFGTTSVSFKVESETTIKTSAPSGTGIVDVRVTVPAGTSPPQPSDRFSYAPVVEAISPGSGPQTGGTEVLISGENMEGVSAVLFGSTNATSFKDHGATSVTAFAPAGVGTVDVRLTGPGGTSEAVSADQFTYTGAAPELGRCRVAGKSHAIRSERAASELAKWKDAGCTEESSEGKYQWEGGPGLKHTFKVKLAKAGARGGGGLELETVGGLKVACKSVVGSGEYSGARYLKALSMEMRGCKAGKLSCTSAGAPRDGEIKSKSLQGEYGVIEKAANPAEDKLGVDFSPLSGSVFFEFLCEGVSHVVRGSVIAPVRANHMEKTVTLAFNVSKGRQKVEHFEGRAVDTLENSTAGGAFEQAGLSASVELKGRAELEINSVH